LDIPPAFDYWPLEGLTYEAKDKLSRLRPATLGQASRVPGVSPADISVLLIHLHRSLHIQVTAEAGQWQDAQAVLQGAADARATAATPRDGATAAGTD
jgi:hypothetical protein